MSTDFLAQSMSIVQALIGSGTVLASVKSGAPINNIVAKSTVVQDLGRQIGRTSLALSHREKTALETKNKRSQASLRKMLEKSESVQEILASQEKKNGLLQALALTLDDPQLALDESKRIMMKQQLMDASLNNTPDNEKLIGDILKAIANSSEESIASKFNQLKTEFTEIGAMLKAPSAEIPTSGVSYNPISPTKLNESSQGQVTRLQKILGTKYNVVPEVYTEFGRDFTVARIYQGQNFKSSIPLDNATYYRSGQAGRTLYTLPQGMASLERAHALALKKAPVSALQKEIIPFGEFAIRELERRSSAGFIDWTDANDWMRSYMTNVERIAGSEDAHGSHVRFQAETKAKRIALYDIGKLDKDQQRRALASVGTFYKDYVDAGVGAKNLLSRNERGLMGNLGLVSGSLYARMKKLYGNVDRSSIPLTLREHQIIGRPTMFSGSHGPIGNTRLHGGSVWNAAMAKATKQTHEGLREALNTVTPYGELTSGGMGQIVLFDVSAKGRLTGGLGGSGMGLSGSKQMATKSMQFAVLDPKAHGYLAGDLLTRLTEAGANGITLTKEELRQNLYLGETSEGRKYIPFNESMESMHLSLAEVTTDKSIGGSKKTVSVVAKVQENLNDLYKVFSFSHKGTVKTVEDVIGEFNPDSQTLLRQVTSDLGIDNSNLMGVSSDMLGKGAIGFMQQLSGGVRAVTKSSVGFKSLREAAEVASKNPILKGAGSGYDSLVHYAQGAMEIMVQRKVDPKHIGLVMAGVYSGAEGNSSKFGMDKTSVMTLAKNLFKDPAELAAFSSAVEKGVTIGYDIFQLGELKNDWGRGRAGVEKRFAMTLHERLLGYGHTTDSASKIVAGIYKNKIGLTSHFDLATHLVDMQSYLTGNAGAKSFVQNKNRISYKDLLSNVLGSKDSTLLSYLQNQENGLVLDLNDAPDAVKIGAKKAFPTGEIFLPGAAALRAAKGTTVKQAEGRAGTVEGPLGQLVNSFQERILAHNTDPKGAEESFKVWSEEAQRLTLGVLDQLSAGKLKGSVSPMVELYDLTHGVGMTAAQLKRARAVTFASNHQAVFQSGESFLSQMLDFKDNPDDVAKKMRTFFTSMERGAIKNKYIGLASIGGRHPNLTTGSIYLTQTFRKLNEVTALGGEDAIFSRIKSSETGRRMLESSFGTTDIKSFAHMTTKDKASQMEFFRSFAKNLDKFTGGNSADVLAVPGLKTNHGDIGIGMQAYMDQDGDHAIHIAVSGKDSNEIMKAMRNKTVNNASYDMKMRSFFNKITDETKGSLNDLRDAIMAGRPAMPADERLYQDIMKESGLAMETGPLDISLRGIHEAFLQYETDPDKKGFARMFLGNLQENFVLKSKKLPIFTPLAERIKSASQNLMETGDVGDLRAVLTEAYSKRDFGKTGINIDSVMNVDTNDIEFNKQANAYFQTLDIKSSYSLEEFLTSAQRVATESIKNGTNKNISKGQWAAAFGENPYDTMQQLLGGNSFTTSVLEGYRGKDIGAQIEVTRSTIATVMNQMDSAFTGKLALGAVAGAALVGLMNNGYAPEPLIAPGENNDQGILNSIRSGSLLSTDPQIDSDNLSSEQSPPPNIHSGATYAVRPNSYMIRGEVNSGVGLSTFGSYFSQLSSGGKALLTVNDLRRPITSNYLDRLTGEY